MLKPIHFKTKELVHPEIYKKFGEASIYYLDENILKVADFLRGVFGSCLINGGGFVNSGLRDEWGSRWSMHHFGKALDLKFKNASPEEVHKFIHEHEKELYDIGLRRVEALEDTPTWVHIDSKPTDLPPGKIHFFKP